MLVAPWAPTPESSADHGAAPDHPELHGFSELPLLWVLGCIYFLDGSWAFSIGSIVVPVLGITF